MEKFSKGYPFKFFILQPVPHWMTKEPSNEEKELFKFLDNSPGDSRKILSVTKTIYEDYTNGLSEICKELDIQYCNLNKVLIKYIEKMNGFLPIGYILTTMEMKVTKCLLDIINK